MPTMTIENIPDDLYETLKKRAEEHDRSINNEVSEVDPSVKTNFELF